MLVNDGVVGPEAVNLGNGGMHGVVGPEAVNWELHDAGWLDNFVDCDLVGPEAVNTALHDIAGPEAIFQAGAPAARGAGQAPCRNSSTVWSPPRQHTGTSLWGVSPLMAGIPPRMMAKHDAMPKWKPQGPLSHRESGMSWADARRADCIPANAGYGTERRQYNSEAMVNEMAGRDMGSSHRDHYARYEQGTDEERDAMDEEQWKESTHVHVLERAAAGLDKGSGHREGEEDSMDGEAMTEQEFSAAVQEAADAANGHRCMAGMVECPSCEADP